MKKSLRKSRLINNELQAFQQIPIRQSETEIKRDWCINGYTLYINFFILMMSRIHRSKGVPYFYKYRRVSTLSDHGYRVFIEALFS